jgi:hypothetical protein
MVHLRSKLPPPAIFDPFGRGRVADDARFGPETPGPEALAHGGAAEAAAPPVR